MNIKTRIKSILDLDPDRQAWRIALTVGCSIGYVYKIIKELKND